MNKGSVQVGLAGLPGGFRLQHGELDRPAAAQASRKELRRVVQAVLRVQHLPRDGLQLPAHVRELPRTQRGGARPDEGGDKKNLNEFADSQETVVLFQDELSLSNTATLSTTWSEKGKRPVFKCKQAPKERVTGLGGMNPLTGQFTVNFAGCGNAETFKGHLRKVLRCNKDKKRIIVYADNVRFHHARRPKPFLAAHPEPELRFPPAYSPDLNPVERVW